MATRLLVCCGEPSGDLYAAELVRSLRASWPDLDVFGVGGDRLQEQQATLLAHVRDLAVVGLVEVLSHIRQLKGVFDRLLAECDRDRPAAAVLVDYPDFNLRLARKLHRRGIPVIYYVSPQLWAWRGGRIRQIQRDVAHMIVIFPFEERLYRDAGVPVTFVGHPLIDVVRRPPDAGPFLREVGADPDRPVIAVLPGSRRKEIAHNLPPIAGAIRLMAQQRPDLQFLLAVAPALPAEPFETALAGLPVTLVRGRTPEVVGAAAAAVVASGTATVETALLDTPMVVVYRLSPLTYRLGRRLVKVPHYAMVNLIAERRVVTELIQDGFTPEAVARETLALLDPERAAAMRGDLATVRARLGTPGASDRAAAVVLPFLEGSKSVDNSLASVPSSQGNP